VSRILVVDDEPGMRDLLRILLKKEGHEVLTAADGSAGLAQATSHELDLVISDIKMPGLDGVGLLSALRERALTMPVIMVTAYAESDSAIQAMKQGAFDYLTKPFKVDEIRLVIRRALAEAAGRQKVGPTASPAAEEPALRGIIGRSASMVELYKLISRVAQVDSSVLITGESGTGKELVARTIHYNSTRAGKPFVAINCGAIPEDLLESELFGHVKGSFTGALRDKKGLFEVADEGTFFLDEVGDMSPALQVKLLRVLQEGTFIPVGGTQGKQVDVRVIAATHKDLQVMVKKNEFREDLFYRINVIRVAVPPLRDRKDDMPILIDHFMRKHKREAQKARALTPEALQIIQTYHWPGNIRELENEIERLLVLGSDLDILPADLISSRIRDAVTSGPGGATVIGANRMAQVPVGKMNDAVETLEREMISQGLTRTKGNKSRLARELGISRSNLILKIQKYQLERPGSSTAEVEEDPELPA